MKFDILTLFPDAIMPYLTTSILGRAQEQQRIDIQAIDVRAFATDNHKTVDDTPYGGGPGMILKIEPIDRALQKIKKNVGEGARKTVVLSAKGVPFTQQRAEEYSQLDHLTLICGRYEGVDQRVVDHLADEELSIGPYVLAGGEIAALAVVEATARLIPGILGNPESLADESFVHSNQDAQDWVEYPQYTKPATYNGWEVPEILLNGDHQAIAEWREQHRRGNLKI